MWFPMRCCGCFSGGGAPGRRRIARGPGLVCSGGEAGAAALPPAMPRAFPPQVEDEPDGARRAERRAEGRVRGQVDGGDAHEPAEVGDRPDRPHGRSEAVSAPRPRGSRAPGRRPPTLRGRP